MLVIHQGTVYKTKVPNRQLLTERLRQGIEMITEHTLTNVFWTTVCRRETCIVIDGGPVER
ncbi:hypothetical protein C0J52_01412 [Blattella germanica]|nr:hypothetical protein C0J52_01412 [Blattella germanica]